MDTPFRAQHECSETQRVCRPFEEAFRAFSTIGPNGTSAQQQGSTLLAVRCGLAFGNTMAALGNYNDAATVHARTATFCDPVLGAMLLEQVAICQASKSPPHLRAALRHLMLAGHRYQSWHLPYLAAVCFRAVASHRSEGWPEVTRALAEHGAVACQAKARWRDAALYLRAALREAQGADGGGAGAGELAAEHAGLLQRLATMLAKAQDVGLDLRRDGELLALRVPRVGVGEYSVELHGLQVRCSACVSF